MATQEKSKPNHSEEINTVTYPSVSKECHLCLWDPWKDQPSYKVKEREEGEGRNEERISCREWKAT